MTLRSLLVSLLVSLRPRPARRRTKAASRPPVRAENGMVVSSQRLASEVGGKVLRQGGNAVDAAVAVGYALAVVDPCCGNIGGGGFATIRLATAPRPSSTSARRRPRRRARTCILDASRRAGEGRSASSATRRWACRAPCWASRRCARRTARCPAQALLAPAIRARPRGLRALPRATPPTSPARRRRSPPSRTSTAIFFRDGAPLKAGDRLVQDDLAATLQAIADGGPGAFYHGPIAGKIVAASSANGGILDAAATSPTTRSARRAGDVRLSRLRDHLGAAAELGRDDDLRDPQRRRGLADGRGRLQLGARRAPPRRGDAPRLRRPQLPARRPRFRAQPG